jgi:hypothetical protein
MIGPRPLLWRSAPDVDECSMVPTLEFKRKREGVRPGALWRLVDPASSGMDRIYDRSDEDLILWVL